MEDDDQAAKWSGPCAREPQAWDLDVGDLIQWLASIRTCLSCPVLSACRALLHEQFPAGDPDRRTPGNPRSVIWAGVAYSESGAPMTPDPQLRVYAARRKSADKTPQSLTQDPGRWRA